MNKVELVNNLYETGLLKDEDSIVLSEGFEEAVIGVTASEPKRCIYDYHKAVAILMQQEPTLNVDEACEWLDEHVTYVIGDQTPIFIKKL